MRLRCYVAVTAALVLAACHSPTDPQDSTALTESPRGRLAGQVTIGPNCPVETGSNPCPTQPAAYSSRKILVYNEGKTSLLFTVDVDSQGFYYIDLLPATYTIDFRGIGIDRSPDVPKTVDIHANSVTTLNVAIDTGLR